MTDLFLELIEEPYLLLMIAFTATACVAAAILKLIDWTFRRKIAKKEKERKNEIL